MKYTKVDKTGTKEYAVFVEWNVFAPFQDCESVDFVMNEDGSAVFWLNTFSVCADYGHVTDVKLDRKEDTLFVHDVFEYYPDYGSRLVEHNCICFADYRIKVPAEYIGVKYLNFNDVYTIVYKDLE